MGAVTSAPSPAATGAAAGAGAAFAFAALADFAFDGAEIQAALAERKTRLAELKDKAENKGTSGKAPAASANRYADLGF